MPRDWLVLWNWAKSVVGSRKPDQYVIITSVTMKTGQSQKDSADTNQFPIYLLFPCSKQF